LFGLRAPRLLSIFPVVDYMEIGKEKKPKKDEKVSRILTFRIILQSRLTPSLLDRDITFRLIATTVRDK
jgi:hypothetical protein